MTEPQSTRPGYRLAARIAVVFAGAMLTAACTPPVKQYDIEDPVMTCAEANRLAHDTLRNMGFRIEELRPATMGSPGRIEGSRIHEGDEQAASVTVECGVPGARIVARESGRILGQVDFKRGYYMSFQSTRSIAEAEAELEAQQAAGAAPDSVQRHDLRVRIDPLRAHAGKIDFGLDMAAARVLPVRVRIDNMTDRTYRLDPDELRLQRHDRKRVDALPAGQVARRIAAARDPDGSGPLTDKSRDQLAVELRARQVEAGRLEPGSRVDGFLYFPLDDYRRARLVLTEEKSEETEGFLIEFEK